jgi:hypothetical protein
MPISLFMPYKVETKEKLTKSKHGPKKPDSAKEHVAKFKKRKCKYYLPFKK